MQSGQAAGASCQCCTCSQGVLAQLDTQTPVMYLDFAGGRLKLFGKLTFPKNKYMVLKAGSKDVLCEDCFDMLVCTCPETRLPVQHKHSMQTGTDCCNAEVCQRTCPGCFFHSLVDRIQG